MRRQPKKYQLLVLQGSKVYCHLPPLSRQIVNKGFTSFSCKKGVLFAEEKYNLGEELRGEQEKNKVLKKAFIVPVLFLLCAFSTANFTFKKEHLK